MAVKLTFLGAARNVTGSCYLLDTEGTKVLVDCGIFQERELKIRNWNKFPVPPTDLSAIFLTHGHLDHCGLIPKLVKEGFKGKIYCTKATADVAKIVLLDSARIQEEDARNKQKRHEKKNKVSPFPVVPLYTMKDVEACYSLFVGVEYDEPIEHGNMEVTFLNAGHILGSAVIATRIKGISSSPEVLFSGDVGRKNTPILNDPEPLDEADYVLIESTYGNRMHADEGSISDKLALFINDTVQKGGKIIIPAFAVERAQELLYRFNELRNQNKIPSIPVYVDSPMAVQITQVLRKHREVMDDKSIAMIKGGDDPFDFKGLHLCTTVEESKDINAIKGPVIIIAGSGMCTGGRIKHHLVNNIGDPKNLVLFVGYQASGTLGRFILEGEKKVRILGEEREVKARIGKVNGFSAHAGQDELLSWLVTLKRAPKSVFCVHGEPESSEALAQYIRDNTNGWNIIVPGIDETYDLN